MVYKDSPYSALGRGEAARADSAQERRGAERAFTSAVTQ